jgi:hypothetical protein
LTPATDGDVEVAAKYVETFPPLTDGNLVFEIDKTTVKLLI